MPTLYKPRNMVGSTIASGTNFVHGTDSQVQLTDAGDFDSEGGYIRIDDGSQWALYEYTGINSNTLTGLTAADYIAKSTASHTFSEGTPVTVEATADLWRDIVDILRGDLTWALSKFSNITGVDHFTVATSAPSAGVADRIIFDKNSGRILHDDGATLTDLGLSESEITLGNLGSLDAGGNAVTNILSLVVSDTGDDIRLRKDGSGNFELYNDSDGATLLTVDENTAEIITQGNIDLGNTHQIINLPDPTSPQDAATKSYVDAIEQGLDIKDSVVAATDGTNIDLSSSTDPNPIDGVTLSDSDRVLLKDQTTDSENGIWTAVTATDPSSWIRSNDADEDNEVTAGLFVFVEEGTINQNRGFVVTTNDPITVGTTDITFTQFSGAGQITAGNGLNKSGDTLNHDSASVHESGGDLSITHNNLDISSSDHHTQTTSSDIDLGSLGNYDAGGNSITNQSTTWSDFNNLDLSNVSNAAQADFATFGQATVNLADGDSLQLARTHIPIGQAIKVIKAAISQKDGTYGTSGLDIEVYNQTDSTSIYSFDSSASTTEGLDEGSYDSPLATGGTGDEIIIRISNSTGSAQDVQAWLTAVIE